MLYLCWTCIPRGRFDPPRPRCILFCALVAPGGGSGGATSFPGFVLGVERVPTGSFPVLEREGPPMTRAWRRERKGGGPWMERGVLVFEREAFRTMVRVVKRNGPFQPRKRRTRERERTWDDLMGDQEPHVHLRAAPNGREPVGSRGLASTSTPAVPPTASDPSHPARSHPGVDVGSVAHHHRPRRPSHADASGRGSPADAPSGPTRKTKAGPGKVPKTQGRNPMEETRGKSPSARVEAEGAHRTTRTQATKRKMDRALRPRRKKENPGLEAEGSQEEEYVVETRNHKRSKRAHVVIMDSPSEREEDNGRETIQDGTGARNTRKRIDVVKESSTESEQEEEEEETDMDVYPDEHEDECAVCRSNAYPKKLLLCDTCPRAFHLYCLDPPLKEVPRKEWQCPYCSPSTNLEKVERILKIRHKQENGLQSHATEYYIKWKEKSYIHCSWVAEESLQNAALSDPSLKLKLKNAREDPDVDQRLKDYTTVERVIAARNTRKAREYLVKWVDLGYDEATWETEDVVKPYQEIIKAFNSRRPIALKEGKMLASSKLKYDTYTDQPEFLNGGTLHKYQLEGLNWLRFARKNHRNVILGDEMGLGKTVQSVAFLKSLFVDGAKKPMLVVVPLSTISNWQREFSIWAPDLNIVMYKGNKVARAVMREFEFYCTPQEAVQLDLGKKRAQKTFWQSKDGKRRRVKFHVLLTSYEMITTDISFFRCIAWECMVVDEGHRLKNRDSKMFQILHDIDTAHRVILTGTPLQNNLEELFMLMHFLEPNLFDSVEEFDREFSKIEKGEQIQKLHKILAPHMLRRMKKDVLQQLPPKRELIVRVELSKAQKQYYRQILLNNYPVLQPSSSREGKRATRLKNVIMELRKCCNHPYLFEGAEDNLYDTLRVFPTATERLIQASGKLELLDRMMQKLHERGHRVLIYSQFTTMLDILEDWLHGRNWAYARLDGSIAGPERQKSIDKFNSPDSELFCFLLSTKAGGLGINLASADTVILFDSDWNPHNDIQAQARAHRMGQKKEVMIYRMVTRASIEERMMQKAKGKLVLEHLVVRKMNKNQDFRQEELDDILRFGAAELFTEEIAEQNEGEAGEDDGKQVHRELRLLGDSPKTKKRDTIREAEGRAGRDGGDSRKNVVIWDDASLERLLDRSVAWEGHDTAGAEEEDDYLKAFKVAQFEVQPEDNQGEADNYWDKLLQERFNREQEIKQAQLGKGKRQRKKIQYVDVVQEETNDEPYTADEDDDSDDDTSLDAEFDDLPRQSKQAKHEDPKDLVVHGLSSKDRATVYRHLMRFGVENFGGKPDWSRLISRCPEIDPANLEQYGKLFLSHLRNMCTCSQDPSKDSTMLGFVPPFDQMSAKTSSDIIHRLTLIWMMRKKVEEVEGSESGDLFFNDGLYRLPITVSHWNRKKDLLLLKAALEYGMDSYEDILSGVSELRDVVSGVLKQEQREVNLRNCVRWLRSRMNSLKEVLFAQYILPVYLGNDTVAAEPPVVQASVSKDTMLEQLQPPKRIPMGGLPNIGRVNMHDFGRENHVSCMDERLKVAGHYNDACNAAQQALINFYNSPKPPSTMSEEAIQSLHQVSIACKSMRESLGRLHAHKKQDANGLSQPCRRSSSPGVSPIVEKCVEDPEEGMPSDLGQPMAVPGQGDRIHSAAAAPVDD